MIELAICWLAIQFLHHLIEPAIFKPVWRIYCQLPVPDPEHGSEKIIDAAETRYVEKKAVEMPLTNFATKDQIDKIEQAKRALRQRETTSFESKTRVLENLNSVVYYPNIYRYYPDGDLAANIIGFYPYLNPANGASYGIEQHFDDILSGETIQKRFSLDPNIPDTIPALPKGASIVLTIDRQIQKIVENSIDQAIENTQAKSGTIVVSNIKNR